MTSKKGFKSQASSSKALAQSGGSLAFGTGAFGSYSAFPSTSTTSASATSNPGSGPAFQSVGSSTAAQAAVRGSAFRSSLSYIYEPPSLHAISDPDLVVLFKNLQKKDSLTRTKALEDLESRFAQGQGTRSNNSQSDLSSKDNVPSNVGSKNDAQTNIKSKNDARTIEDGILEAWVALYARTAIDNARRVRQLAHVVQGQIAASFGKRMARRMPLVVGAWLAGALDGDKVVAQAARDSFAHVFATEEKRKAVWKAYRGPICSYCSDCILKESPWTLSDERTISPEDAESKYARTVAAAVSMLAQNVDMLSISSADDLSEQDRQLFQSKALWSLASHSDPALRRSIYRLLLVCLERIDAALPLEVICTAFLGEALRSDQRGTLASFLEASTELISRHPDAWTRSSFNKPPHKALMRLLEGGSQGGSSQTWQLLSNFLDQVPLDILFPTGQEAETKPDGAAFEAVTALKQGVQRRDEPAANQQDAWTCYLHLIERLFGTLSPPLATQLCKTSVLPLVMDQFATGTNQTARKPPEAISICATVMCDQSCRADLHSALQTISDAFLDHLQQSLPEASAGLARSQESIVNEGRAWYSFIEKLQRDGISPETREFLQTLMASEAQKAIEVLNARKGRPYSAAAILDLLSNISLKEETTSSVTETIRKFAQDLPSFLMVSPSSPFLVHLLGNYASNKGGVEAYKEALNQILHSGDNGSQHQTVQTLAKAPWPNDPRVSTALEDVVLGRMDTKEHSHAQDWTFISTLLQNSTVPDETRQRLLESLSSKLEPSSATPEMLQAIHSALKSMNAAEPAPLSSSIGSSLVRSVYVIAHTTPSENHDLAQVEVRRQARALLDDKHFGQLADAHIVAITEEAIRNDDGSALAPDFLVHQIAQSLSRMSSSQVESALPHLLPRMEHWDANLALILAHSPDTALAYTGPLYGAVYAVKDSPVADALGSGRGQDQPEDSLRQLLNTLEYVVRLFKVREIKGALSPSQESYWLTQMLIWREIYRNYSITRSDSTRQQSEILEDDFQRPLTLLDEFTAQQLRFQDKADSKARLDETVTLLQEGSKGCSPSAYYHAQALARLAEKDIHPSNGIISMKEAASQICDRSVLFSILATVPRHEFGSDALHACNRLISDLSGISASSIADPEGPALAQLLLLNALLDGQATRLDDVPASRQLLLVNRLVPMLDAASVVPGLVVEALKLLQLLFVGLTETFGSFWEQVLDLAFSNLKDATSHDVSTLRASLEMLSTLRHLGAVGSNEDLQEALDERHTSLDAAILDLARSHASHADFSSGPQEACNSELGTAIATIDTKASLSFDELSALLNGRSPALQKAAFELLHRRIPADQEQLSIDAALSKDFVARLPQQLIAMISNIATDVDISELKTHAMPQDALTYLLSWSLLFDHWTNASYQVQSSYVNEIKELGLIPGLLQYIVTNLTTARNYTELMNPSSFEIEKDSHIDPNTPLKNFQHLLLHLYYLALLHMPQLVKGWWRSDCSRGQEKQVADWTEKYFSPLVIRAELETVGAWDPNPDGDDPAMEVKVNARGREVVASYPIDETHMAIRVALPANYPLDVISFSTIRRVAVEEKKWASWLNTSQIVTNFASASQGRGCIVDGLVMWRRNVVGALQAQSECAICYSIVSPDRMLPTKRCGTCKNTFHGQCLYRWFKSSSTSGCPLCRNPFHYG